MLDCKNERQRVMHHIKKLLFVGVLSLTSMTTKAAIFVASGNGDSNLYIIDETGAIVETVGDTGEFFHRTRVLRQ